MLDRPSGLGSEHCQAACPSLPQFQQLRRELNLLVEVVDLGVVGSEAGFDGAGEVTGVVEAVDVVEVRYW